MRIWKCLMRIGRFYLVSFLYTSSYNWRYPYDDVTVSIKSSSLSSFCISPCERARPLKSTQFVVIYCPIVNINLMLSVIFKWEILVNVHLCLSMIVIFIISFFLDLTISFVEYFISLSVENKLKQVLSSCSTNIFNRYINWFTDMIN